MKTPTETLNELFVQMGHDYAELCDTFDDALGKPTGTIDECLNTDSDEN